ncbi:hypothetical protein AURDEDRAFT_110686 [Auricularia subglabra TFB-10046 SS5]|nr:hypothetical protein AURDEDRAFT_110686 [Auricularia subglabra TFB-10046 SS5]
MVVLYLVNTGPAQYVGRYGLQLVGQSEKKRDGVTPTGRIALQFAGGATEYFWISQLTLAPRHIIAAT